MDGRSLNLGANQGLPLDTQTHMPVSSPTKNLIDLNSSPRRSPKVTKSVSKLGTPMKAALVKATPKKSGSKLATPMKKSPAKSKNITPLKKSPMKNNNLNISDIQDLPDSITEALGSIGINRLSDLQEKDFKSIEEQITPMLLNSGSGDRAEIAQKMQKELLSAWIRFLVAKADNSLEARTSWRDCIDTKKLGTMTAKGMIEAETFLKTLRPNILIRQRSALKKVSKPKSKHISFAELKQGKSRLVKVPKGEALAAKVNKDILEGARKNLRQTKK